MVFIVGPEEKKSMKFQVQQKHFTNKKIHKIWWKMAERSLTCIPRGEDLFHIPSHQKKIGDRFPGGPNLEGSAQEFYEHLHAPTKGRHTRIPKGHLWSVIAHASSASDGTWKRLWPRGVQVSEGIDFLYIPQGGNTEKHSKLVSTPSQTEVYYDFKNWYAIKKVSQSKYV